MSNVLRLGSILLLAASMVDSASIGTCQLQKDCVVMTVTEKATTGSTKPCSSRDGACAWQVCMKVDMTKRECQKKSPDTISHTCLPQVDVCGGGIWEELVDVRSGFEMCQTGKAGQKLQFLLKDGNGCSASSVADFSIGSGALMGCGPSTTKTCTGNAIGVECIWTVTLPSCSGSIVDVATIAEEVASCEALEEKVPENFLVYDSGEAPSCTIGAAADVLKDCDCVQPQADCQFLQCSKPIPDPVMAQLKSLSC